MVVDASLGTSPDPMVGRGLRPVTVIVLVWSWETSPGTG